MGQRKLERFEAIKQFTNVLELPEKVKGNWQFFFKNKHPLVLELACGKGEYSVQQGRQDPKRNFIGVDIKGNRIYVGAKTALAEALENVAFLRIPIAQITDYFAPGEVSEIWIVFPDPFLRASRAKNRLTHPRFLRQYQQVLKPGAVIHLKTDSGELFDFTLETLKEYHCIIHEVITDVYGQEKATGALGIQTFYEKMHLAEGRIIRYIAFSLPENPILLPEKKKKNAAQTVV